MSSKRRHEGYLLIDHRDSPGVTRGSVTTPRSDTPIVGNSMFESATITCSHCQCVVVLNPDRTRERAYCKKCDHYICDRCGQEYARTFVCRPFRQVLDEAQEAAFLTEQRGGVLITPR